jgi:hypothetical protein
VRRSLIVQPELQSAEHLPAERPPQPHALTEKDAIEIWIARWLRIQQKVLVQRYSCDSRRLYEIWWGERFPASRVKAAQAFCERYPALAQRTDFGYRRIPRGPSHPPQPDLFGR